MPLSTPCQLATARCNRDRNQGLVSLRTDTNVEYITGEGLICRRVRQCAGGASYGGHLANWLQASTTRYRCLISHAGLINIESQWGTSDSIYHREVMAGGPVWEQGPVWREHNPIRFARNFRTPILVTIGENDFRVPLNQTLENWSVLQRLQIPSKLIVFPDANHWILKPEDSRFFYREVHDWLARYLKQQ